MNDGGPAFPFQYRRVADPNAEKDLAHPGMTLRDYFAAQVLNGIFAGRAKSIVSGPDTDTAEIVAGTCYEFADAMLAERTKP